MTVGQGAWSGEPDTFCMGAIRRLMFVFSHRLMTIWLFPSLRWPAVAFILDGVRTLPDPQDNLRDQVNARTDLMRFRTGQGGVILPPNTYLDTPLCAARLVRPR